MRFDPFRELDRFSEGVMAGSRSARMMPMEAFRRGEEFLVVLDLPGVDLGDVEVTVERNVVSIRATRRPVHQENEEVIVDERPQGEFSRQLFLGDNLDSGRLNASMREGVLTLTIPVAEASKPRRVDIGPGAQAQEGSAKAERSSK
jgi:HSP20 family protein